jgi:hypothetical protein
MEQIATAESGIRPGNFTIGDQFKVLVPDLDVIRYPFTSLHFHDVHD